MLARILIGVGAWLLGAITATCGSLLAVSLLGNSFGVSASPSQQLSVAAVNSALAVAEKQHVSATGGGSPSATGGSPNAGVPHAGSLRAGAARDGAMRRRASTAPAAQQTAQAGTLLASPAGTVVASCAQGGAYLISWSPAPGYGSDQVARGPAAMTWVTFDGGGSALTMDVSCRAGIPTAATSWGHDDGGSGGDAGSGTGSGGE